MALEQSKKFQLVEIQRQCSKAYLVAAPNSFMWVKGEQLNMLAPIVLGFKTRENMLSALAQKGYEIVDYGTFKDVIFSSKAKAEKFMRELNKAMEVQLKEANQLRRKGVEGYVARKGNIRIDGVDLINIKIGQIV